MRKETDYVKEGRETENEIEKVPDDKPMGKKTYPISPNQRRILEKNKITIPDNCSYAQASKLIKASMAKSKEKLTRANGQEALIPKDEQ